MSKLFENKIALVTGGASGIGKATAISMARENATVIVTDLEKEGCKATVEIIEKENNNAVAHPMDVTNEESLIDLIEEIDSQFGQLDIAFNNAGIGGDFKKTADYSIVEWNQVINVNLTGVWLCMKHEIELMLKGNGGAIVNTASVAGLVGMGYAPAYTAAKHGVIGLTKNAALEYAKKNIRVNAICPGVIETNMTKTADEFRPGWLEATAKLAPIGRIGQPEEMASVVVWLCSQGASYVTGHAMTADGGFVAR